MNSETVPAEQSILEKHLKKITITSNVVSLIGAVLVAMGIGYGFYYSTSSTLDIHTEDIKDVKESVENVENQLNDINVYKGISTTELKSLEEKVEQNHIQIEKMDEKLDKILYQTR